MGLIILYWVLILVMLVGVVGALVPAVPGVGLILGAILVWGFITQFNGMAVSLVVTLVILLASLGIEFLATYWGVKKFGASSWSQIGATVGLIAGMFGLLPALPVGGPLVGILFGSIAGAFIGEFAYRKELTFVPRLQMAAKVCLGIVVGSVVGNIVKAVLALAAVIVFLWTTLDTVPQFDPSSFHIPRPDIDWPVLVTKDEAGHWHFNLPDISLPDFRPYLPKLTSIKGELGG